VYNTFPLMGGQFVPPGYQLPGAGWRNAFENPAAAQFHHRLLAIGTATLLLILSWVRGSQASAPVRRAMGMAGLAALVQVGLGIATLLLKVPVALGVLHQVTGLVVLTAAFVAVHRAGAPEAAVR